MFKAVITRGDEFRTGMVGYATDGDRVYLAISDGECEEEIYPNTMGMNSGKHDSNGKHIYAFDVIANEHGDEFVVNYDAERCAFILNHAESGEFFSYLGLLNSKDITIVNNIFSKED